MRRKSYPDYYGGPGPAYFMYWPQYCKKHDKAYMTGEECPGCVEAAHPKIKRDPKDCYRHDFVEYKGFTEVYEYCTVCDYKKWPGK